MSCTMRSLDLENFGGRNTFRSLRIELQRDVQVQ